MPLPRITRRLGLLLAGIVLLATLAGVAAYRLSEAMSLQELRHAGQLRLELYANSLTREIDKYAYFPATLELEREALALLDGQRALTGTVNHYLEQLNQRAGTMAIYLLDRQGQVVATSNWQRPDSFLGEDLSYRPYVAAALTGETGRFFGVGTTRGETGYYLSAPLRDGGRLVGLAVVKVSLEQLEQSWATVEVPTLVSDENGVVILASQPTWKFRALQPLSDETRERLTRSLHYNARPLAPLGLTRERVVADDAMLVQLASAPPSSTTARPVPAGRFLAQQAPLGDTGWKLTVLTPTAAITSLAWTRAALAALLSALLGILGVLWLQRQRHQRDRLRAREALQRAHDALELKVEERTRTLHAAQQELVHAGKLAVIGQLATGVAHELNQPLTALRSLAGNTGKFLQRGDLDNAQVNLARIDELVAAMGKLTSQLKQFARKAPDAPRAVTVRRSLDNALFLLEARVRRQEVAVEFDLPDPQVAAFCDANRLEQVLVNLIANALDAMAETPAPRLRLSAQRSGEHTSICVQDNGPGLSADASTRLFEPFFTTKAAGSGLGLGLAISAGILRDSHGTLTGANAPTGGACFTLTLPAADAAPPPAPFTGTQA